jgi:hypothetical protein
VAVNTDRVTQLLNDHADTLTRELGVPVGVTIQVDWQATKAVYRAAGREAPVTVSRRFAEMDGDKPRRDDQEFTRLLTKNQLEPLAGLLRG